MEDSIKWRIRLIKKHNKRWTRKRAVAGTSDDRNGVVVNRAIDSTRGIPNCLIEERCSEKIAVHKFMRKVSTKHY